jgi:hypothetical protein
MFCFAQVSSWRRTSSVMVNVIFAVRVALFVMSTRAELFVERFPVEYEKEIGKTQTTRRGRGSVVDDFLL